MSAKPPGAAPPEGSLERLLARLPTLRGLVFFDVESYVRLAVSAAIKAGCTKQSFGEFCLDAWDSMVAAYDVGESPEAAARAGRAAAQAGKPRRPPRGKGGGR